MKQKNSKSIHVLIACGGTGGHLFPGIAVGEVLASRGHQVTLLISEKKIDTLAASGHPELRFEKMPFLAMPKPWSPKMFGFLKGLWQGTKACRKLIRDNEVDVVLGMGGFTSFAPLYAGRKEGCQTLIHESNAIPGKANRLNARYSDIVLCGLEACKTHFPKHGDVRVVGTPIRSSMRKPNSDDPRAFFKLDKDKRTLLIMGGSQGARGVNRAVGMALEEFEKMGIQVLHIAGNADFSRLSQITAAHAAYHVLGFCDQMPAAYAIADLVIARSGASSLTEIAVAARPSILVPYPFAADDHQTRNAEIYANAGASILVQETDLTPQKLADLSRSILLDAATAKRMGEAARNLAMPDAAERVCTAIENSFSSAA